MVHRRLYFGFIIILIIIVIFFCAIFNSSSCVPVDFGSDSTLSAPQFLVRWIWNENDKMLFITLNQHYIWENGENGSETFFRVQRTLNVVVDNVQHSVNWSNFMERTILVNRFDENQHLLGSHTGDIVVRLPFDHEPQTVAVSIQTKNGTCLVNVGVADDDGNWSLNR
jgi:hypothetical protein